MNSARLHFYSTNHEAEKEKTKTLRGEWRRKMKYIRVSSEETSSTARSSDGVEVNIVKHAGHILVGEVHLGGEGQMEDQVREWSRRGVRRGDRLPWRGSWVRGRFR